jgi:uncharacterized protein YkwD
VHHLPAGPPLSARVRGATTRWLLLLRRALRRRGGRLALGALASVAIAALVVSVPVGSGSSEDTRSVSLDASASSSSASSGESPVVMGRDGKPVTSAAFAGRTSQVTYSAAPDVEAAGSPSTADDATAGSTPAGGSDRSTSAATQGSGATGTTGSSGTGTGTSGTGTPTATAGSPTTSSGSIEDRTTDVGTPSEPDPAPPVTEPAPQSVQEELLALVNSARAGRGCDALAPDGALASAARAHSVDMRDAGLLSLLTPAGGSLLDLGGQAAVLAHGPADPEAVLQSWLADQTDATALLDCGAGVGGVGVAKDDDGGPWWTLLLG